MIIDKPKVLELLEAAVAERGKDYIDPGSARDRSCSYVVNGKPGCIAGLVFYKAGIPITTLAKMDNRGSLRSMNPEHLRDNYYILITPEAHNILKVVQGLQDRGKTWGAALESARIAEQVSI